MAKNSDREQIKRMTQYAQKRADLDLAQLLHDNYQRCPGCARSFTVTQGIPAIHFGERFCGECIDRFKDEYQAFLNKINETLKNT